MQMLASDLANPEFVNPLNPDSQLFVEFFLSKIVDKWRSDEETAAQGRNVVIYWKERKLNPSTRQLEFTDKDWEVPHIRIMRPGDKMTEIVRPVLETDKMRWPAAWQRFEISQGVSDTQAANIPGWKLEDWAFLKDKPELLRDLKHKRFYTVELLAAASDAQIQWLGTGGLGFRQEARKAVATRNREEYQSALEARDNDIAALRQQLAELTKAVHQKGK